jgi:predicted CoA-binding protein
MFFRHPDPEETMTNPSDARIARLLREAKRIAVVGLSSDPERPSYNIARDLLEYGYEIIPVNPREREVLGMRAYTSLAEVPGHIDIVDVFRKQNALVEHAMEAVEADAGAYWMQLGLASDEAARIAGAGGLVVVQNCCILVEYARLVVHGARIA